MTSRYARIVRSLLAGGIALGAAACASAAEVRSSATEAACVGAPTATVASAIVSAVRASHPDRRMFIDSAAFAPAWAEDAGRRRASSPVGGDGIGGDVGWMSLSAATVRETGAGVQHAIREGGIHLRLDRLTRVAGGLHAIVTVHDTERRPDGHRALSYDRIRYRFSAEGGAWCLRRWDVEESS